VRTDEISLVDEDAYERDGIPHAALAWLRANSPVHWHPGEAPGQPGFWAVTRHRDVEYVSRHPDLFSSYRRLALLREMPDEDIEAHRLMMLNMDPPQHTRQRSFVNRVFTPKAISQLESGVTRICSALLDEVASRGEADFVRDIAAPLPLQVLCEVMGVPAQDRSRLSRLSNQLAGYTGEEFVVCPPDRATDMMRGAAWPGRWRTGSTPVRRHATTS
jgi:cholest-4-en-3-one 26-monooxygenase